MGCQKGSAKIGVKQALRRGVEGLVVARSGLYF